MSKRRIGFGVAATLSLLSLGSMNACVFDGDASLGSDEQSGGAAAGEAATVGGSTTAGKSSAGGSAPAAGKASTGGAAAVAGSSAVAGEPSIGAGGGTSAAGEPGTGAAGEPSTGSGGAPPDDCQLPIETGPCDDVIPMYAYDSALGKCRSFNFGGCEGNANRFRSLEACLDTCERITCPSHLQTDTVYFVQPLNRTEMACIWFDNPVVVSCSMLVNPELTVPTQLNDENHCVRRDGNLFWTGMPLRKELGWEECSDFERDLVNQVPDCAAL